MAKKIPFEYVDVYLPKDTAVDIFLPSSYLAIDYYSNSLVTDRIGSFSAILPVKNTVNYNVVKDGGFESIIGLDADIS